VLAYRAVNFWLPIPFGGLAYASIEFEKEVDLQQAPELPQPSGRVATPGRWNEC